MPNQIAEKIKKQRSKILRSLSDVLGRKFKKKFINSTQEVLFENQSRTFPDIGTSKKNSTIISSSVKRASESSEKVRDWQGYTKNYLKVLVKDSKIKENEILKVKIVKLLSDGNLLGELIK